MPERPILIMPRPEPVDRPKGHGGGKPPPRPTDRAGQAKRIKEQFAQIQSAFVSEKEGEIERVLVMETSCRIDDLQNAVNRVPELEWLAEIDVDDINLHDIYDEKTGKQVKGGRFYIVSSTRQAVDSLLHHWNRYQEGLEPEYGIAKFNEVFAYLITLRYWSIKDRLYETGILKNWKETYEIKKGTNSDVEFEIELHYRKSKNKREEFLRKVKQRISDEDGKSGKDTCIEGIGFYALKATLPIASLVKIMECDWDTYKHSSPDNFPSIFTNEAIRYFRPTGQHIDSSEDISIYPLTRELPPIEDKPPALAILDGAPMLRHNMLNGRVLIDDPDNYESAYEPIQQIHGTAMASLICHGDLNRQDFETSSLTRPIYVRPIMKPNQQNQLDKREVIPPELFQEDVVERAVREMFENENSVASNVRVINLSIGNIDQLYLNHMSPWARLLDWLAFEYKVLFIVSAGNYLEPIREISQENPADYKQKILKEIDNNRNNHRLLAPAESMNALTVGALQGDAYGNLPNSTKGFDPISNMRLPAPYSRIGPGYRNSIKPDIFTEGGRLLYEKSVHVTNAIDSIKNSSPPGVQMAHPGTNPERLSDTAYTAGTSNAAAIVSHGAGRIFEMLEDIRPKYDEDLEPELDAVVIKTLLVHSASKGENDDSYSHLKNPKNSRKFKRHLSRYLGYGNIDIERVLECTKSRATAIGHGRIQVQQRHHFSFPLPIISSVQGYARLTITLAWFSPINPHHIGMRKAKLFFENDQLKQRNGHQRASDWQQVRKGTVQHEIFELNKNNLPGQSLDLFVECAEDAGTLDDEISYGLAVTLEVAEHENIDLYQVISNNIRQQVRAGNR